jgi:hypothetical protein
MKNADMQTARDAGDIERADTVELAVGDLPSRSTVQRDDSK